MESIIYSPPVVFVLVFFSLVLTSRLLARYSNRGELGEHALDPYACGQRNVENYVNPDYSQYFMYAFIFTVVHILILVVATAPSSASILPVAYIVSGIIAIFIAFKR